MADPTTKVGFMSRAQYIPCTRYEDYNVANIKPVGPYYYCVWWVKVRCPSAILWWPLGELVAPNFNNENNNTNNKWVWSWNNYPAMSILSNKQHNTSGRKIMRTESSDLLPWKPFTPIYYFSIFVFILWSQHLHSVLTLHYHIIPSLSPTSEPHNSALRKQLTELQPAHLLWGTMPRHTDSAIGLLCNIAPKNEGPQLLTLTSKLRILIC